MKARGDKVFVIGEITRNRFECDLRMLAWEIGFVVFVKNCN